MDFKLQKAIFEKSSMDALKSNAKYLNVKAAQRWCFAVELDFGLFYQNDFQRLQNQTCTRPQYATYKNIRLFSAFQNMNYTAFKIN